MYGIVKQSQWETARKDCAKCKKGFGLFASKVNCPRCGAMTCKECCMSEIALTNPAKPDKVCLDCFMFVKEIKDGRRAPVPNYGEDRPDAAASPSQAPSPVMVAQPQPQSQQQTTNASINEQSPATPQQPPRAAKAPPPGVYSKQP
eukprot:PhF_6_TR11976/c0_g1_i1/m.19325